MICLFIAVNTTTLTNTYGLSGGSASGKQELTQEKANELMKNSGTGFIKNVGQVYDYNKKVVPYVYYSLNANSSSVFLTDKGLTYSIVQREPIADENPSKNLKSEINLIDKNVARLDMNLIGASIKKENIIESAYVNDVPINFYGSTLGENALNLKLCKQIIIKNVYPNIDWVLKMTNDEKFKYDFIVHPGGNPNLIQQKYIGATDIILNEKKDVLNFHTPLCNIEEGKLYCYTLEDNKVIDAAYNLSDKNVSINLAKYDKQKTLVIDPTIFMVLTWSTFYGGGSTLGSGATVCNGIKTDDVNNRVYVVGKCFSSPFPNYNNGTAYYYSPATAGSSLEAFISAFDLAGAQKWATYYLSTEVDQAEDVTVDGSGNIYMVGFTESHNAAGGINFLTTQYSGGFIQSTNAAKPIIPGVFNYAEGFIVRFNSAGQLQWATLFGGDRGDIINSVACDNKNTVYVCGTTDSQTSLPTNQQGSGYYSSSPGTTATVGFIAAFKSVTSKNWCTYFGTGATGAGCYDVACDPSNNVYVTGEIGSTLTGFPFLIRLVHFITILISAVI